MTNRTRTAVVIVLLLVLAVALGVCAKRGREPGAPMPAELRHESGTLVYTFHTPTGTESLFDRSSDPGLVRNLGATRPGDLERLRTEMLRKLHVESLEELRRPQQELIDRLHGLGYF